MDADEDSLMSFKDDRVKGGGVSGWLGDAVKRRFPILRWGRRYTRLHALADAVAGATLGLTLVPQSIAYASLAGLPVQYGLYSSFIGTIVYAFMGTVKEVSIGPTSLMAVMVMKVAGGLPIEVVPLLAFQSGLVVMAMGLLRLDFLVELISPVVTSAFTSMTALLIILSQMKNVLGLSYKAESMYQTVVCLTQHWRNIRLSDSLLAVACCAALLSLRKLKDLPVSPKRRILKKTLWFISISRNALVVCVASVLAYLTYDPVDPLFKLSGRVQGGIPPIGISFTARVGNETLSTWQLTRMLGTAPLVTPVVMVLANIAIAKAFTMGRSVDARQEMLTLGVANAAGACFHAMPTCGAFTRSAVSHASGVRSPAAGLVAGTISLLALIFLTEYFFFIPKATLGSVLICAVVFMIDVDIVRVLWRGDRLRLCVLAATVWTALCADVELCVPAGALADVAALLYRAAVYPALVLHQGDRVTRGRVQGALMYLNVERALSAVADVNTPLLIIDMANCSSLDYSSVMAIERTAKKFKASGRQLIFYNCSTDVARALETLQVLPHAPLRKKTELEALSCDEKGEDVPLLTIQSNEKS